MGKNIIVTGGAGYIGSHVCKQLALEGFNPITIDNFSRGFQNWVKWGPLFETDLRDFDSLLKIFKETDPDGVVHLAAYAYVPESVKKPLLYYDNNVIGGINLLKVMRECQVKNLVFSSPCAVYGIPNEIPIKENSKLEPINPYGETKLILENLIGDISRKDGLNSVILRYFNVGGADSEMETGECHEPETHLIPLAIKACVDDSYHLSVFGNDYSTPDGTCIRDYIHVSDLANAHVEALKKITTGSVDLEIINLGSGTGFSVMEIIHTIEKITGMKIKYKFGDQRKGDPAILISKILKAEKILNWTPHSSNIDDIISSALKWANNHN